MRKSCMRTYCSMFKSNMETACGVWTGSSINDRRRSTIKQYYSWSYNLSRCGYK